MRLESYLFTEEAIESARDYLAEGGVFSMYNYYREGWLVDRYAGTLDQAFGRAPCIETLTPADEADESHLAVLTVSEDPAAIPCDVPARPRAARRRACRTTTTRSPTCAAGRCPASTSSPSA